MRIAVAPARATIAEFPDVVEAEGDAVATRNANATGRQFEALIIMQKSELQRGTAVALCALALTLSAAIPASAQLTRIAGSGAAGFRDGLASEAEFLLPSALAYDSHGNLYIADAAAQRIRMLGTDGRVRTIAGSGALDGSGLNVAGGFKDGPALQAQFNHPSGVALGANGQLFVGDTNNHAIRLISNGSVTTFAGNPNEMGGTDGALSAARFSYPHQLVVDDSNGTMYVADYGNGLRRIANGAVTTVHKDFVEARVTGVSIGTGPEGERTLFVADLTGLSEIDLASDKLIKFRVDGADTQGFVDVGHPYAVAAYGGDKVVFTDLHNDEVKALSANNLQYITGPNADDAVLGRSAEPGAMASAVHGPLGVAMRADGHIAIADGGHRVIAMSPPPAPTGVLPVEFSDSLFPPNAYRIAVLSNSPAYWAQTDRNSAAHYLEQVLSTDRFRPDGHVAKAVFFRNVFPSLALELTRGMLSKGVVDSVVLIVNSNFFSAYNKGPAPNSLVTYSQIAADPVRAQPYLQQLKADLGATYRELKAAKVQLLLVAMPFPWDLGPSTNLFATEDVHNLERETWMQPPYYAGPPLEPKPLVSDYLSVEHALVTALRETGAPVLDLWPILRSVEKQTPGVLYPTEDLHFSGEGRKIVGAAIARELERLRP